jgi:PAS domain S-box-containing protein
MTSKIKSLGKFASFRIVLVYAGFSAIYIYTSDYFLEMFVKDVNLLTKLQTVKGLGFIIITTSLLYVLVKTNSDKTAAYYQQIIDVKQDSDNQLLKSKEEYMSLFNHSPLPMWLFDYETLKFIHVNEAACSIYGYTLEEYASMTLRDIRPAADIPFMEQMIATSLQNDRYAIPGIVRHQKKNGEIIQVKVKTTYVTFEGKQVRLASAVDVTAEMEIQEKLLETNSRLHLASEIASLGYWTNNLVTSEIQWSDEIYNIFEVDPKTFTLTLDSVLERIHPDDRLNFDPDYYHSFEDKTIKETERRIITDSGAKWLLVRQYLIKDKDGKPAKLEGIVLDITKRKMHEQETIAKMQQIESQNKALKEISWKQSHLVRAPLANLLGFVNLLKDNDPPDESLLGYISDSAEKLDNVIRDIVSHTNDNNDGKSV